MQCKDTVSTYVSPLIGDLVFIVVTKILLYYIFPLQITDPSNSRFEVPISVPTATKKAESPNYVVEISKKPFGLVVKRKSTGAVL